MGNHSIKTAVKERRWEDVESLLKNRRYNRNDIDVFVTTCEAVNNFYVSDDIVAHFSSGQLNLFITAAVKKSQWQAAGTMLKFCEDRDKRAWVIEEARQRADDDDFDSYILPHCNDTEQELRQAVQKSKWKSVGENVATGVRCPLDRWAVEEASKRDDGLYFENYVLSHCGDDELESVLKHKVRCGMWMSVGKVLERGVSDARRRWAVQEACKQERPTDLDFEQVHLTDRGFVICCPPDLRPTDLDFERYILPHCSDDQLESVLKHLITRCLWRSVGGVLGRGVSDTLYRWAVEEAKTIASDIDFDLYILPYCSDTEQELIQAVQTGHWKYVGDILGTGARCALDRWAVKEASKRDTGGHFKTDILPHCSDDLIESVLKLLVTRGMWLSVDRLLERGVSDTQRRWAVQEACKQELPTDLDFEQYILPHCSDDQLEPVLKHLTSRCMWQSVCKVLGRGVGDILTRWAVEEASKTATDSDFELYILPHCNDDWLEYVLTQLVTRGMWLSVGKALERGVSDTQRRWAVQEACTQTRSTDFDFERFILPHCSDDQLEYVLTHLVRRCMWESVYKVLERGVSDTNRRWAAEKACKQYQRYTDLDFERKRPTDVEFELYILPHCSGDQLESVLKHFITRCMWRSVGKVLERGVSDTLHRWAVEEASKGAHDLEFKQYILPHCNDDQLKSVLKLLVTQGLFESIKMITERGKTQHVMFLSEMCRICSYISVMINIELLGHPSIQLLISCLNSGQLSTEATNVALRFTIPQKQWGIIRKVSLSHVWEQVRRELFRAAVEQRRWSLVKKWADHTVYDNQRWWAQEEAYKKKQWDVMLLLTDYGMTDIELMRVRYRLAKYADWDVVVRMIECGVDVTEVREVVESAMVSKKTARDETKRRALVARWHQLRQLEDYYTKASSGRVRKWSFVLFYLHRHHSHHSSLQQLLQRAIKDEAWRVVRHLLRLGLDTAQRDSLLTEMISRHQWGVCRVLLEKGVGVQSCLEVLPVLMDSDQWTLVARVMEYNVGDECRQRVMRRAMERREGSVVWRCITTMQHYHLSVEERETLFQLAMSGGVWEVVKPLMEELDSTGLRHRDTALFEAIEQHQWDVVDYCQWHKADINMKDDEGQTPLNRAGRKSDWKAVKELVIRGGDPNVPDIDKHCILNIVIHANKWYLTRLIIEYHGHIHVVDDFGSTPLQFLIDKRKGKIIHHTLMWCPDQSKVVNKAGETTLHAIALDKRPELMYSQIVRGVNPLTLTQDGQSTLQYAVEDPHSARRMVAECIKLGFGTHQPQFNVLTSVGQLYQNVVELILHWVWTRPIPSPLLWAVVCGEHVVAHMLYESGSCSYTQLLQLYTQLYEISDPFSEHTRSLLELISRQQEEKQEECIARYEELMESFTKFLPYLREMATTPRSLVSTCRLVISHHLIVRGRRERDVQQLPLTDKMKNYVLFSDLADPDYAWYLHGILPPVPEES